MTHYINMYIIVTYVWFGFGEAFYKHSCLQMWNILHTIVPTCKGFQSKSYDSFKKQINFMRIFWRPSTDGLSSNPTID